MKKCINPNTIEIQRRFFYALENVLPPETTKGGGLKGFCVEFGLNRTKYSRIKNALDKPVEEMLYKCIDIDALAALCGKYGVSCDWLLLGVGEMINGNKE